MIYASRSLILNVLYGNNNCKHSEKKANAIPIRIDFNIDTFFSENKETTMVQKAEYVPDNRVGFE